MRNLSLFDGEKIISYIPINQFIEKITNENKILTESEYIVEHYKKILEILQRKQLLNSYTLSYAVHNLSDEDLTAILLEIFSGEVVNVSDIYQVLIEVIYPMYRPQIRKVIKKLIEKNYVKELSINTNKLLIFSRIDCNKAHLLKYI